MNTQNVLDGKTLKHIADSSPTATAVFHELSRRERDRQKTDITRVKKEMIKHGEVVQNEDYFKTWQELEQAKIGKIQKGRNGLPARFAWNYSLKSVSQAAMQGQDLEANVLVAARTVQKRKRKYNKRQTPAPIERVDNETGTNTLYIPLRRDFPIKVVLPNDVSTDEISTIIDAIRSV